MKPFQRSVQEWRRNRGRGGKSVIVSQKVSTAMATELNRNRESSHHPIATAARPNSEMPPSAEFYRSSSVNLPEKQALIDACRAKFKEKRYQTNNILWPNDTEPRFSSSLGWKSILAKPATGSTSTIGPRNQRSYVSQNCIGRSTIPTREWPIWSWNTSRATVMCLMKKRVEL